MSIARRDAGGSPPVDPPRRLRSFLSMRRLSATALEGVRRAVEESPSLRERMAEAAPTEEDAGGRASWLFVHRPDGWEDELAELEGSAVARSAEVADAAEERVARRRLRVVEDEVRRLQGELDAARRSNAASVEVEAALGDERRARVEAEEALASLRARVSSIERERDAAHRRASAADRALAAAAARSDASAEAVPTVDVGGARASVTAAQVSLTAANQALEVAAAALDEPGGAVPPTPPVGPRPAVRLPAPLPPGLFDDDPAAADHLVRLPSALLLVDGYNLSLRRWGDLPLPEQRARLVDALNGLVARTGVDVEVVFDGEEDSGRGVQSSGGRRRAVRVTFSPDAVDADEVLLALVERVPRPRPVVVATDDRRVQRAAAARGANVVGAAAMFVVLGVSR